MRLPSGAGDNPANPVTPTTRSISFTINDGNDPISGAKVTIDSTERTTGGAGGCSFNDIADGSVSVTVTADGYQTKIQTITVSENSTSFTISLTAEAGSGSGEVSGGGTGLP